MKKLFLFILLAAVAVLPASAQKSKKKASKSSKAPEVVQQAFTQSFANAADISWHKMASGNWFAAFSQDTLQAKAEYTPEGQWVATRTAYAQTALPDTLLNAIKLNYPQATIGQILRIERADVPAYYQIALDVAGTEKDIFANDAGSISE